MKQISLLHCRYRHLHKFVPKTSFALLTTICLLKGHKSYSLIVYFSTSKSFYFLIVNCYTSHLEQGIRFFRNCLQWVLSKYSIDSSYAWFSVFKFSIGSNKVRNLALCFYCHIDDWSWLNLRKDIGYTTAILVYVNITKGS